MASLPTINVLVLNRFYRETHVCTLARAISLIYTEHAEIVYNLNGEFVNFSFDEWIKACGDGGMMEPYRNGDPLIHTSRIRFVAPRVIRLTNSNYSPSGRKQLRPTRKNILIRDEYTCQYCRRKLSVSQLNLDHVIPKSRGGRMTWDNLVACCLRCNTRKGNRLPQEAGMRLVRQPSRPSPATFFLMKLDRHIVENYGAFLGLA